MIVSLDRKDLHPAPGGAILSIGVFDGVHLGHQAILRENVRLARQREARPTVVTFRRHPKELLLGRGPRTLTSLDHRIELFARAGIEHAVALNFDEGLREQSAADFAREVAVAGLHTRAFVLGQDSKFGRNREGSADLLKGLGYEVHVVPQIAIGGRPISSTVIREAVELGDFAMARAMLGRGVAVQGVVVHGDGVGQQLGFPTANLNVHHELHPPTGVYACRVCLLRTDDQAAVRFQGVANIGTRPTRAGAGEAQVRIEVHLFDFYGDLYGKRVELEFVERLRGERRFPSLEELAAQIARDAARARLLLAQAAH